MVTIVIIRLNNKVKESLLQDAQDACCRESIHNEGGICTDEVIESYEPWLSSVSRKG